MARVSTHQKKRSALSICSESVAVITASPFARDRDFSPATSTVKYCCYPCAGRRFAPQALAALNLQNKVQILSDSAEQTAHAVITGSADLGLCSLPLEHHALELHWIGQSSCVVALPESDPLAAEPEIQLSQLAGRRFIVPWSPQRLRGRYEKALKKVKAPLSETIETNSSANILGCVRAGLGVAILEPVTGWGVPMPGVVIRP